MDTKSQGNVLFLILVAVALFAALSYAVTSSTRGGGENISTDKAKANAASIVQFGATMRNAVMRMKISNGCTETTLDFYTPVYKSVSEGDFTSVNSTAPADGSCKIFASTGGNVIPFIPVADAVDFNSAISAASAKPGHGAIRTGQIPNIGTDGPAGTTSANDLIFLQLNLNKATCMAINSLLDVPNRGDDAPGETLPTLSYYGSGSYAATGIFTSPEFVGQPAFCAKRSDYGTYYFVQTLLER